MKSSSAAILLSDSGTAQFLGNSLSRTFHSVYLAGSVEDLRNAVAKHRSAVVVVDIEIASVIDVKQLCRDFPKTRIVCTHRVADEAMWMRVMEAGAADLCPSSDSHGILSAAIHHAVGARSAAA